jgi:hypothetical protein
MNHIHLALVKLKPKLGLGILFFLVKICHHLIMFEKKKKIFRKQVIKFHAFKTFLGKMKQHVCLLATFLMILYKIFTN